MLAPRRFGKSSLALRAIQDVQRDGVLVAYCDLMRSPTKVRFAAALAKTISTICSPPCQLLERAAALIRTLRVRPTVEVDPLEGDVRFSFEAPRQGGHRRGDRPPPGAPGRHRRRAGRRTALVLDEFQEVVRLDETLPNRMRVGLPDTARGVSCIPRQQASRAHAMFNDRNEPFWRSAQQIEIGRIPTTPCPPSSVTVSRRRARHRRRCAGPAPRYRRRASVRDPGARVLHLGPRPTGYAAHAADVEAALADVLRAEHNNLSRVWEGATQNERLVLLALRTGPASLYSEETRATRVSQRRRSSSVPCRPSCARTWSRRAPMVAIGSRSRSWPSGSDARTRAP